MNFPELYKINPLHDGVDRMLLYYIDRDFLEKIINPQIKYTWIHKLPILGCDWQELDWPIFEQNKTNSIPFMSRQLDMDILIETEKLASIYPYIEKNHVQVIQLDNIPPYYLRLESIHGKERYRLLNESGYYFELDNGGGQEWGTLTSSDRKFWQNLKSNSKINWNEMSRPNGYTEQRPNEK